MRFFSGFILSVASCSLAMGKTIEDANDPVPTGAGNIVVDVGAPLEVLKFKAKDDNSGSPQSLPRVHRSNRNG